MPRKQSKKNKLLEELEHLVDNIENNMEELKTTKKWRDFDDIVLQELTEQLNDTLSELQNL